MWIFPLDVSLVRVDRDSMILVMDNLLDNAIRYSAGTRSIRIGIRSPVAQCHY